MTSGRYRKKPVVINAIEFTGDNAVEIARFLEERDPERYTGSYGTVIIETLEGQMRASVGDYIIRGVSGEHYPCKPDIFWRTYEAVGDDDFPGPLERRLDLLETDVTG